MSGRLSPHHRRERISATTTHLHKLMTVITPDQLLESTAIGCGLHQWGVDGGSIQVAADELRPALEQAYDPSMPNWPSLITWDDEDGFFVA